MGDEDQRGARPAAQAEEEVHDGPPVGLVEVAGGLVGEKEAGLGGEGAGQGHALLLAPGHLGGVVVGAGAEAHGLELGRGAGEGVPLAGELQGCRDVLQRGHGGDEVETLEHHPHVVAAKPGEGVLVHGGQVLAHARTSPPVACSRPPMSIRRDDLPEPLGPTSPTASPCAMDSEMPRRISTGPALPRSVSRASESDRAGSGMTGPRAWGLGAYGVARGDPQRRRRAVARFAGLGATGPVTVVALGTASRRATG
jgi:hypothetical protein